MGLKLHRNYLSTEFLLIPAALALVISGYLLSLHGSCLVAIFFLVDAGSVNCEMFHFS